MFLKNLEDNIQVPLAVELDIVNIKKTIACFLNDKDENKFLPPFVRILV